MHKIRMIVLLCGTVALAACKQESPQPQPVVPVAVPAATADMTPKLMAGALKSELPEGFVLPFAFHRLYDNTGKTETGAPQRRILAEYLGQDAHMVQAALSGALQAKGFAAPATSVDDTMPELTFSRADGASMVVTITPDCEKSRAPKANGIAHLVWNAGA